MKYFITRTCVASISLKKYSCATQTNLLNRYSLRERVAFFSVIWNTRLLSQNTRNSCLTAEYDEGISTMAFNPDITFVALIYGVLIDSVLLFFIYRKREYFERKSRYFTFLVASCLVIIINGFQMIVIISGNNPAGALILSGMITLIIFSAFYFKQLWTPCWWKMQLMFHTIYPLRYTFRTGVVVNTRSFKYSFVYYIRELKYLTAMEIMT